MTNPFEKGSCWASVEFRFVIMILDSYKINNQLFVDVLSKSGNVFYKQNIGDGSKWKRIT